MQIDLTGIINVVIALIGILITTFLIPYIKSKLSAEQQNKLSSTIKTLVSAAEQIYGAGTGEQKLRYVAVMLKQAGYNIDVDNITDSTRAMIEAAVLELGDTGGESRKKGHKEKASIAGAHKNPQIQSP